MSSANESGEKDKKAEETKLLKRQNTTGSLKDSPAKMPEALTRSRTTLQIDELTEDLAPKSKVEISEKNLKNSNGRKISQNVDKKVVLPIIA